MAHTHLSHRDSRLLLLQSGRWRQRLIFVAGGVAVGLSAVGLTLAADVAQGKFQALLTRWPYAPLIVTPLGFGVAVLLATLFFPNTQGLGIPQVIAA